METESTTSWQSWMRTLLIYALVISACMFVATRRKACSFYARYYLLFFSYVVFGVLCIPFMLFNPGSPKNAWWLIKYGKFLQLPLCRVRITRKGCPYPEGPCVIVCNHQSSLDSPIYQLFIMFVPPVMMHEEIWPGNCVVIMKRVMKYTGPFGLCLILSGTIFVDRKNTNSAKDMLRSTVDAIHRHQYRVWFFPEGTRRLMLKKRSEEPLLQFKKGAFNLAVLAQVPIVPIVISSQEKFFNFRDHRFEPGEVTATVLPPIPTTGLTMDDVQGLADETRSQMMRVFLNGKENCKTAILDGQ